MTAFAGNDELLAFLHHEPEAYRVRSTFNYTGWWFTSSQGVISVGFGKADWTGSFRAVSLSILCF